MQLAVLFLSCGRMAYLRRCFDAVRRHFVEVEPDICPEWICFDNGSNGSDQQQLLEMDFDLLMLSRVNLGVGPAMNRLLAMIRTPYFLNLQDDWMLENPRHVPFVRHAVSAMEADNRIAHVKVDAVHFLNFGDREFYDGPFALGNSAVPLFVQNPRKLWGGFAFPPAVTRTNAMFDLGPFREDAPLQRGHAESEYSSRFAQRFVAAKSPEMALFQHIGEEACSGWAQQVPV